MTSKRRGGYESARLGVGFSRGRSGLVRACKRTKNSKINDGGGGGGTEESLVLDL